MEVANNRRRSLQRRHGICIGEGSMPSGERGATAPGIASLPWPSAAPGIEAAPSAPAGPSAPAAADTGGGRQRQPATKVWRYLKAVGSAL